jgi:hypothetical protein
MININMKLSSVYFIIGFFIAPFLIFLIPIDALNAFMLRGDESSGISFGQLYKLPIILTMLLTLIFNPIIFFLIICIFSMLLMPTILNFNHDVGHYIKDIINISKYLTPLISY